MKIQKYFIKNVFIVLEMDRFNGESYHDVILFTVTSHYKYIDAGLWDSVVMYYRLW